MAVQLFNPVVQPYNNALQEQWSPQSILQAQGMQQQNALRGLQVQQETQAIQQQNVLMHLSQQPGMRDDQGLPTPQFINALAGVAPAAANAAMKLRSDTLKGQAEMANWAAQAKEHQAKTAERLGKTAYELDEATLGSYMSALEAGQSDSDARQTAAMTRKEKYDAAVKSGSAEGLKPPDGPVDPVMLKGNLFKWDQYQKEKAKPPAIHTFPVGADEAATVQWNPQTGQYDLIAGSKRKDPTINLAASAGDLDEDAKNYAAEIYNRTGQMPSLGYGTAGAALRKEVLSRAAAMAKEQGQTGGDVVSSRAGTKADTTSLNKLQPMYDAVRSFSNNAIAMGQRLGDLADKVDATGVPAIERWIRAGKKATGDPDVAALNAQMTLFRNEAAKIVTNPNLTGVLTVEAQREMERSLDNAASPAQIKSVVGLLQKDFASREQSLADQIKEVKGRISGKSAPSAPSDPYVERRTTSDGRVLGKKADGTIEEIK